MTVFSRSAVGLLAVGLMASAGCGGNFVSEEKLPESGASLKGKVLYGSEEIHYAMIRVKGGGREATGKVGPDGTYLVENCPTGAVTIAVNTDAGRGDHQTALRQSGDYTGPDGKGRKRVSLTFTDLPKKYFEPSTSGLTYTVVEGENKHDIVIKK